MMTLQYLKDFLNVLPEEQLQRIMNIQVSNGVLEQITEIQIIDEDMYFKIDNPEAGCKYLEDYPIDERDNLMIGVNKGDIIFVSECIEMKNPI